MKSFKQLYFVFAVVSVSLLLTSCSKEEPSINGTKWVQKISGGSVSMVFSDSTFFMDFTEGAVSKLRIDGKYKYTHPTVQMTPFLEILFDRLKGTINGTSMNIVNDRTGADIGDFIKE